jgi:hypothetical protein
LKTRVIRGATFSLSQFVFRSAFVFRVRFWVRFGPAFIHNASVALAADRERSSRTEH